MALDDWMFVVQGTVFFFFFRSVLHQLYGNPSYYDFIRAAGIHILRENPVRSIESNSQLSWMHYLTSKFCPSTWADGIIIQAMADASNLKAHTQILWKLILWKQ